MNSIKIIPVAYCVQNCLYRFRTNSFLRRGDGDWAYQSPRSLSRISLPGPSPLLYSSLGNKQFFHYNSGAYFFINFSYFLFMNIRFLFVETKILHGELHKIFLSNYIFSRLNFQQSMRSHCDHPSIKSLEDPEEVIKRMKSSFSEIFRKIEKDGKAQK